MILAQQAHRPTELVVSRFDMNSRIVRNREAARPAAIRKNA